MGVSPKWVKSKRRRKKKKRRERLNDGDNNGQATHGARKHAWRTHGARKPPGPISGAPRNLIFYPHPLVNSCKKIGSAEPPITDAIVHVLVFNLINNNLIF